MRKEREEAERRREEERKRRAAEAAEKLEKEKQAGIDYSRNTVNAWFAMERSHRQTQLENEQRETLRLENAAKRLKLEKDVWEFEQAKRAAQAENQGHQ